MEANKQIALRLQTVLSIRDGLEMMDVNPDAFYQMASDPTLTYEDYVRQVLDVMNINGVDNLITSVGDITHPGVERQMFELFPQQLKDLMFANGYFRPHLRDRELSFWEKAFGLTWLPGQFKEGSRDRTGWGQFVHGAGQVSAPLGGVIRQGFRLFLLSNHFFLSLVQSRSVPERLNTNYYIIKSLVRNIFLPNSQTHTP